MVLIGVFILGALVGSVSHRAFISASCTNDVVKSRYLKEHIVKLEEDAKQAKRAKAYKSSRRHSKKSGASRSAKGSSKA